MADDVKTPEQLRAEQAEHDAAAEAQAQAEAKAKQEADEAEAERQKLADPPREIPAADLLRAFEDEHVGEKTVRIGDRIERGYGSPFAALSDEKKRQYAALEKLVASEQKLADAHAALIQAEADHESALAATEPKPDAAANQ